jgi:hypothetical protein
MNQYACWMRSWAAIVVLVCAMTAAHAQDVTGSISGTVTDPSGAAVKGATVELINTDRNETVRTLVTNGAGFYTASSLPSGTYTVKVTDEGFKLDTLTGLVLHVDDKLTANRKLVVGSTNQSVSVEADELHINLEDAAASGLFTGTQVRELELSTRNYEQLLSLQPGVDYTGTTDQIYIGPANPLGVANTVAFSVNGQRTSANNWTIDGADNVDRGGNLTLLAFPSVDAIAEFKTLRGNYSAEYGRSAAGQVNVVTRSGTNTYHGGAYEFFRNDDLNANSWADKNFASPSQFLARPPLRYNDYGYTFGGPVWIPKIYNGHNKTFFFWSQEFRKVISYNPIAVNVPTAAERAGTFPVPVCINFVGSAVSCADAGVTQIPTSALSANALAYLKDVYSLDGSKVPFPNAGPTQDPHAYNYNARNIYNDAQELLRVDQAIGQKFNVFYRFIHDSIPSQEPFGYGCGCTGALPGVQTTNTRSPGTQQLGHITYVHSSKLLMDGGYAYSYGSIQSAPAGAALSANSPDINVALPFPNALGTIPNISFTGYTGLTDAGIYNDFNRNHNVFGDVTKVLGTNTIIVGVSFDRYQKTENATGGNLGTFSFTASKSQLPTASQSNAEAVAYYQSFANFLTGTATGGFSQSPVPRTPNLHANTIEAYVQDNWKIIPRLTLNFGVRYSYFAQPTDSSGLLSNFQPSAYNPANAPTIDKTGSICVTGAPCTGGVIPNNAYDPLNGLIFASPSTYGVTGHASPYGGQVGQADKGNVAPRFGFAYDVFGDGKTSLRGGYGIAYDATLFGDYEQNAFNNPPLPVSASFSYTSFDNPAGGTAKAAALPSPPVVYSTAPAFHSPYSQQYSLDVQQELMPSLLFDLGYYGAHDTHLIGYDDINSPAPGAAAAAGILPAGGFVNSAQTTTANQVRPFKGYAFMWAVEPIFNSNYNSLQLSVKKHFKGKSLIEGSYTWQRNLSNGPIGDRSSAPQDRTNIKAEYGRAAYDRNNFASIDFVWDLPWYHEQHGLVGRVVGGWEISGIVALSSGIPTTVTASQGGDLFGTSTVFADVAGLAISGNSPASFRPNQTGNPQGGPGLKTKTKWFNTSVFSAPSAALGLPGDEKRGAVTAPGYNREDLGLFRNFRIVKDVVFQLRGEAFNVLNHTNYNAISATATSTTFGTVTGARESRILQVAGKLSF